MEFYDIQHLQELSEVKNLYIITDPTPIISGTILLSHLDLYNIEHDNKFVKIYDSYLDIYQKDSLTFWINSHIVDEKNLYHAHFRLETHKEVF